MALDSLEMASDGLLRSGGFDSLTMASRGMLVDAAASGTKTYANTYTRLGLYGGPRDLYGDFTIKSPAPAVKIQAHATRLGLYGGPRDLYGSFAGKVEITITPIPKFEGLRRNIGRMMR